MSSGVTSETEATVAGGSAELSRRLIEETFNEGNLELIDQYVAPGAPHHDPALPAKLRGATGPDALRQVVQMYRTAFPDVHMTVEDLIDGGDKITAIWRGEGTHRGELEGLAPTGTRVTVTGISVDRWQDGKVVESWTQWDNLGLARQLGAAPPEGHAVEKVGIAVQRLMASRMRKKNQ